MTIDKKTGIEIVYHGIDGETHVTATFPISRFAQFTELVTEQQRQWEQEGATGVVKRIPAPMPTREPVIRRSLKEIK